MDDYAQFMEMLTELMTRIEALEKDLKRIEKSLVRVRRVADHFEPIK